jgi:hypothetical protein
MFWDFELFTALSDRIYVGGDVLVRFQISNVECEGVDRLHHESLIGGLIAVV